MMPPLAGRGSGPLAIARDEVERMMVLRMDLDRYEAQVVPHLRQRVRDLVKALEALVAAAGDSSEGNREEALAIARRVLANTRQRPRPGAWDP